MLRATALELPARWNAARRQLAEVDLLLAAGPETDLVLLPEASITGYVSPGGDFDLRPFAEPLGGPMTFALAAMAKKHRVHLAGPLVEKDGDRFHNTLVFFDRDGQLVARYQKRHPWMPETWAAPGEGPLPELDVEGMKVTAALCFDAHFLAEESAAALERADVLLFASAWVEEEDTRATLLGGLARRFDVAVVNANWGAGVPKVAGQGRTMILGRDGRVLTDATGAAGAARVDATVA